MAYTATVVPVMLASPGDVSRERDAAREILHDWNYAHSLATNVVLMPVGWETHAAPDLGGHPQELINERVLSECDLLVGIFWTRLGTPTGRAASGSVEEIERHLAVGKPAMVYFSAAPVAPQSIQPDQFHALTVFRSWCEEKGLIENYENLDDFRKRFRQQLQIQLNKNPYLVALVQSAKDAPGQHKAALKPQGIGDELSKEAQELLVEASLSADGQIWSYATIGERHIKANGKVFGGKDARSHAPWEHAIKQLIDGGLVVERGRKGEIFQISQPGYELAEQLRTLRDILG